MSDFRVILPVIFAESVEDRIEAFNHALVALKAARFQGRTFVLSDGVRTLLVAPPRGPLKVPDRDGRLVVAEEQDLLELIRSFL